MFHSIVLVEMLSRDSDSGGYGVTLLGTSCEGLRGFEERLMVIFLFFLSFFSFEVFLYYFCKDIIIKVF